MGEKNDGSDSVAVEVAPASHWPTIRALILVVSAEKKGVSSTLGMQGTVATSTLFPTRAKEVVPRRMKEMESTIKARDFDTFGKVTMRDSNSFHATCLDSEPPIFYLNDISRAAIRVVEGINAAAGEVIAAYTFDAGPNAVIYYEEKNADAVVGPFKAVLDHVDGWSGSGKQISPRNVQSIDQKALAVLKEGVSRVILTGVGEGPQKVPESLIGETGEILKR